MISDQLNDIELSLLQGDGEMAGLEGEFLPTRLFWGVESTVHLP